ncbi:hypothetical protein NX722_06530 [Endozoicomonas gorgoniicola]|uniref:Uncharacterized protein n=1 Tax=Endozoicomonas gorgoniicola TaxID=1234144 RepID=A0ABT3MSF0_9GAMM|nr:hypothetical protein [Endozoicomonas gorgoniicola]MCW7552309.1 hypothetical protein [Endozoicomonas gorgoniicola]
MLIPSRFIQTAKGKNKSILSFILANILSSLTNAEMTPGYLLFTQPLINIPSLKSTIPSSKNILDSAFHVNGKKKNPLDINNDLFSPHPKQTHFFVYPLTRSQARGSVNNNDPQSQGAVALDPGAPNTEVIALQPNDFSEENAMSDLERLGLLAGTGNLSGAIAELTSDEITHHMPPEQKAFLLYWTLFSRILNRDGREAAIAFIRNFSDGRTSGGTQGQSTNNEDYFSALQRGQLPEGQPVFETALLLEHFSENNMMRFLQRGTALIPLLTATMRDGSLPQAEDREFWFTLYWTEFAMLFNNSCPDDAFLYLERFHNVIFPSDSAPLRSQYGIYYTPSRQWLEPVSRELERWALEQREELHGLEVFSGNASLSFFLHSLGIPMLATDPGTSHTHVTHNHVNNNLFFNVAREGAPEAVTNHPETNFLVMSWPTVGSDRLLREQEIIRNAVMNNLIRPGPFDRILQRMDEAHPALAAVLRWQRRGPILFIGQRGDSDDTDMQLFFEYLKKYYNGTDYEKEYKSGVGLNDFPTLYFPIPK